jgi:hypothetical protein
MNTKKKFQKVYYVIQTVPFFKVCGFTFRKSQALVINKKIKEITGIDGVVVKMSRSEIESLNFK